MQKLQGTWVVASGQANGETLPEEFVKNIVLTIKGSAYTAVINEQTDKGTFKINAGKQPMEMDIDSENADAGHLLGIYEVGPETLKVCYAHNGAARPKSFSTKDVENVFMFDYKRKKE